MTENSSRPRMLATALALLACCLATVPAAAADADHLVLTEVVIHERPGVPSLGVEFVEIANPTALAVDLSQVYLTDAIYNSPPTYYYDLVLQDGSGGGGIGGDFNARFPDGASLAAGDTIVIALGGSANYQTAYGRLPDFELFEDGIAPDSVPELVEVFPGSIAKGLGSANTNVVSTAGWLSDTGESLVLYTWDGETDLVQDLDYLLWGTVTSVRVDKTGVAVDGPDAGDETTAYAADTGINLQVPLLTAGMSFTDSYMRTTFDEGAEVALGGNGLTGHDETSEPLTATWFMSDNAQDPALTGPALVDPAPFLLDVSAAPASPYADATVTVSTEVVAFDAVTAVTAWYRADGGSWIDVACADAGGVWSAVLPGQPTDTVVDWYVEATAGGSAVWPSAAPAYFETYTVSDAPQPGDGPAALLFTEVATVGSAQEFVEIANPNDFDVELGNYYLTDGIYAPGSQFYWRIVEGSPGQTTIGGGAFADFHSRFPEATIGAGDTITVSIGGSEGFAANFAFTPTFELYEDGGAPDNVPDMLEVFPGSIVGTVAAPNTPSLTNGAEVIILYYWDGETDLVTDIDVFMWGSSGSHSYARNNVSMDGPDADSTPTAYQNDTPVASQHPFVGEAAFGDAYRRVLPEAGNETATGGNGPDGQDELSENLAVTFALMPYDPASPNIPGYEGDSMAELVVPPLTFLPSLGEIFPIDFVTMPNSETKLRILDLEGRVVRTLYDSRFDGFASIIPGQFTRRVWDGRDDEFELVPTGMYIVHMAVRNRTDGDEESLTAPAVVATRLSK